MVSEISSKVVVWFGPQVTFKFRLLRSPGVVVVPWADEPRRIDGRYCSELELYVPSECSGTTSSGDDG